MSSDGSNAEKTVSLHQPSITEQEKQAVQDVLDGGHLKGGGQYDAQCNDLIMDAFGTSHALMMTSCTHALEMAALLLDIDNGDEVIMPSWTFPSTANPFILRGADPVFVDVNPDTLNMAPEAVEAAVTENTVAIVPVHYAGVACDMDAIMQVAEKYDVPVVEDAAQAVNAQYADEYLGTIGALGCYSFHATKNIVAGEGGALLVNERSYMERAEMLRQKGTDYEQFRRGEVDRYTWRDVGSSYVPSELQAALAYVQIQRRDELTSAREQVHETYDEQLSPLEAEEVLQLPVVPENRTTNYHIYHVRTEDEAVRDELVEHLQDNGVEAYPHYEPLHTAAMGRKFGYEEGDFPVTEQAAATLIRLPIHSEMTEDDAVYVANQIKTFYANSNTV